MIATDLRASDLTAQQLDASGINSATAMSDYRRKGIQEYGDTNMARMNTLIGDRDRTRVEREGRALRQYNEIMASIKDQKRLKKNNDIVSAVVTGAMLAASAGMAPGALAAGASASDAAKYAGAVRNAGLLNAAIPMVGKFMGSQSSNVNPMIQSAGNLGGGLLDYQLGENKLRSEENNPAPESPIDAYFRKQMEQY